jgi:hypothetical protein
MEQWIDHGAVAWWMFCGIKEFVLGAACTALSVILQ